MNIVNISGSSSGSIIKPSMEIESKSIAELAQERVLPRQIGTGMMRGQQTILGPNGEKIVLGLVPGSTTDFAISFLDADDNIIAKSTGVTDYKYDLDTNKNYYQNGKLPDGSYGGIYVKSGVDVEDVFN